jgi:hypothetical protein
MVQGRMIRILRTPGFENTSVNSAQAFNDQASTESVKWYRCIPELRAVSHTWILFHKAIQQEINQYMYAVLSPQKKHRK